MIAWLGKLVGDWFAPAIRTSDADELAALDRILDPRDGETLTRAALRLRAELESTREAMSWWTGRTKFGDLSIAHDQAQARVLVLEAELAEADIRIEQADRRRIVEWEIAEASRVRLRAWARRWKACAKLERRLGENAWGVTTRIANEAQEALRFYAAPSTYETTERTDGLARLQSPIGLDMGARARKVVGT